MIMRYKSLYTGNELEKRLNIQERYSSFDLKQWLGFLFNLRSRHSLLDLGCGNGKDLLYFSPYIYKGIGVDFSRSLIEQAEKLRLGSKVNNIEFVAYDCNEFLFKKFKFDVIYSNFAFYYFNKQLILQNILKMLKKDGVAFIAGSPNENSPELSFLIANTLNENDVPFTYKKNFSDVRKYFKFFKNYFKYVDFYRFLNVVNFPSISCFLLYLENTTLYQCLNELNKGLFLDRSKRFLKQNKKFHLTKIVDVLRASN